LPTGARSLLKICGWGDPGFALVKQHGPDVRPSENGSELLASGHLHFGKDVSMSLSSAKNYALRAARSQDQKEAAELLSKAILELAASIEATDAKIKKLNKSG
jgi:hypothetical protein